MRDVSLFFSEMAYDPIGITSLLFKGLRHTFPTPCQVQFFRKKRAGHLYDDLLFFFIVGPVPYLNDIALAGRFFYAIKTPQVQSKKAAASPKRDEQRP
ncbi:hypothetical protein D3C72_1876530 [compost metagenome]